MKAVSRVTVWIMKSELLIGNEFTRVIDQHPSAVSPLHRRKTISSEILLKQNSPHGDGDQGGRDVRVNWRFKNIYMQRENQRTSNGRCSEFKDGSRLLTFAPLAVVEPAEGLVLGDVGVEELERVLRDDAIRDDFVVSYDVDKGQRAQPVFGVGLHRVELDFSCWAAWRLAMLQTLGTAGGGGLTVVLVLHPGEGDPSQVALAEAQQEGSRFSVLQQVALHLFTHEAHDVAARWRTRKLHGRVSLA